MFKTLVCVVVGLVMTGLAASRAAQPFVNPPPGGALFIYTLKVGSRGDPCFISFKVFQVIDKENMLVEAGDSREGKRTHLLWVKCKTSGITDGEFFGAGWSDLYGHNSHIQVTGTKTYKTAVGTRTVFVVEGSKAPPTKAQVKATFRRLRDEARRQGEAYMKEIGLTSNEASYVRTWAISGKRAVVLMTSTERSLLALKQPAIKRWANMEMTYRRLRK